MHFLIFLDSNMKRMKNILTAIIMLLVISCATRDMSTVKPENAFSKFTDRYYEEYLKFNPLEATQLADNRYNDQLPLDVSETYREAIRSFYQRYRDSLQYFDRSSLTEQQQISYDILEHETQLRLDLLEFPDHLMPVHQFWGMTLTMPQIGSGQSFQPFRTAKDYDDFLKRIDAFTVWVDQAIANMREGIRTGHVLPKVLAERVVPVLAAHLVDKPESSLFWGPVAMLPADLSPADKERLPAAYRRAISEKVIPA